MSVLNYNNIENVFTVVFILIIIGSVIITINCKLLKVNISFFQSLSIIGYSIFPFLIGTMFHFILPKIICFIIDIICTITAVTIEIKLLNIFYDNDTKGLLIKYPLILYFSLIGVIIAFMN